jgi:hypothetical protein
MDTTSFKFYSNFESENKLFTRDYAISENPGSNSKPYLDVNVSVYRTEYQNPFKQ